MRQLQYAEDVVKKGFTGFQWQTELNQNFADEKRKSVQDQIDYLFNLSNQHRCDNVPEFADEKKYLPVREVSPLKEAEAVVTIVPVDLKESKLADSKQLTQPPLQQTKQDDLLNAVLLGLGVVVVLKILS